jgi:hypothetical protein
MSFIETIALIAASISVLGYIVKAIKFRMWVHRLQRKDVEITIERTDGTKIRFNLGAHSKQDPVELERSIRQLLSI